MIAKLNAKYGQRIGICFFVLKHFMANLIFSFIIMPGYYSQTYSTAMILYYIYIMFAKGADYYIYFFPKTYVENLQQIAKLGRKYDPLGMRPPTATNPK